MSETRSGLIKFAGVFHEWQFRLMIKIRTTKSKDRPALTAKGLLMLLLVMHLRVPWRSEFRS